MPRLHPVLSCAAAKKFEAARFGSDTEAAIGAMRQAGAAVANVAPEAFAEAADRGRHAWIFFGKGANGADALFAARHLASAGFRCLLVPAFERKHWIHPVRVAHDELIREHPETIPQAEPARLNSEKERPLVIDGITGSGFRAPFPQHLRAWIRLLNESRAFVVAVDLPSGAGDIAADMIVRADMTVATGILKRPLLADERVRQAAGRIRYADLGFFDENAPPASEFTAAHAILNPLREPSPASFDKRSRGHVAIFGGSREMPGALMMNTVAALGAGAGLVTAHAPESVHGAFAASAPEAMWIPVAERDGHTRWSECLRDFFKKTPRIGAVVCGSGMGGSPGVAELARTLIREYAGPLVLDADALRPAIIEACGQRPNTFRRLVLTPHAGEFRRIAGVEASLENLSEFAGRTGATIVLKGPGTRVAEPGRVCLIPFGGPVLARGGSGDLLAGILGALLAREDDDPFESACRATAWHGCAADHLAAREGDLALRTLRICDSLGPCLRGNIH